MRRYQMIVYSLVMIFMGSNVFANCNVDENALQASMDEITNAYDNKFKLREEQVKKEAEQLTEDAPDPSAVEATLDIEIETSWDLTEMKLHVPEFRLEDKKMVFHLPTIDMKEQTWIYHTPSIKMERRCVNKPPETVCWTDTQCVGGGWSKVCIDVPQCKTRSGGQMCTDIPIPFMQEQETILHVPETRMVKNEIIMGVPVVEMKLQTWKMHLPQFTVKSISGQVSEIEDRASEIENREKNAAAAMTESMSGEIKQVSADQIESVFACHFNQLEDQKNSALSQIDMNIKAVEASLYEARKIGAKDFAQSMSESLEQLMTARENAIQSFDNAQNQVAKQKGDALNQIYSQGS